MFGINKMLKQFAGLSARRGERRHKMADTIELIKKHTQEYNEYMLENGKYSFHRFTDGSVRFTKPIFVTRNIVKETGILLLRPVRELEELVKASMDYGALVRITDSEGHGIFRRLSK